MNTRRMSEYRGLGENQTSCMPRRCERLSHAKHAATDIGVKKYPVNDCRGALPSTASARLSTVAMTAIRTGSTEADLGLPKSAFRTTFGAPTRGSKLCDVVPSTDFGGSGGVGIDMRNISQ